jgi:cupredoxin-like protein
MAVVALIFGVRARSGVAATEQVIHLTAKKFEYSPSEIRVKKGQPVVIEIVSLDRNTASRSPTSRSGVT